MKAIYRGYELFAKRQRALGGWFNTYYHAMRQSDGFMLIDNFSEGDTPINMLTWMRCVIDVLKDQHRGRVDKLDDALGGVEYVENQWRVKQPA